MLLIPSLSKPLQIPEAAVTPDANHQCYYNLLYLVLVQAFLISDVTFRGSLLNTYLTCMEPVLHLGFLLDSW